MIMCNFTSFYTPADTIPIIPPVRNVPAYTNTIINLFHLISYMIKILHKTSLWLGLLMAAIWTCVPTAGAYTVDEIIANGEWMTATYRYTNWEGTTFPSYDYGYSPCQSETVRLEKLNDQQIVFHGIAGSLDFVFDLVDTNGNLTTDGVSLQIPGNRTCANGTTADGIGGWMLSPTKQRKLTFDVYHNQPWKLDITRNNNGKLCFRDNYLNEDINGMLINFNGMTYPNYWAILIDWADFEPFEGTGIAMDEYSHWADNNGTVVCTQTITREYPVNVKLDFTKNTFSIANFSNLGYAWNDKDGAFIHPEDGFPTFGKPYDITGTIIPEENKLVFDADQCSRFQFMYQTEYFDYLGWQGYYGWFKFKLAKFTFDSSEVTGKVTGYYYEPEEGKPQHNEKSVDHHWVTNHGRRRTFDKMSIEIEPYTYGIWDLATKFPYQPNFIDSYNNTVISNGDCTLDVDLILEQAGWDSDDQNGYVKASIKTNANDMYVDHYDILVIGGYHDYIDEAGFQIDNEKYGLGVRNAKVLVDGETDNRFGTVTKPAATRAANNTVGSHDYSIDHWVMKDFIADQLNDKGEYTFFIRANYKPETGLAPTFHALTHASGAPTPTGITNMTADDNVPAVYYNLNGIEVAEDDLTPGIYICRRGATAKKVVIK